MRWLLVGLIGLTLAGCHQAPQADNPSGGGAAADGSAAALAFNYGYTIRLPSDRVSEAQEQLAQACEQLAPPRCRITGMNYNVDADGQASAELDMVLAAPIARRFGRNGVAAAEGMGGSLAGAEITGTDTQPDASRGASDVAAATAEIGRLDAQLARSDLSPQERAELLRQRGIADDTRRAGADLSDQARQAVRTTPVSFRYRAGTGVGLTARLADAAQTALSSLVWTLWFVLTALALLGPPALVIVVLVLVWRRWLGRLWRRAWRFGTPPRPAD